MLQSSINIDIVGQKMAVRAGGGVLSRAVLVVRSRAVAVLRNGLGVLRRFLFLFHNNDDDRLR